MQSINTLACISGQIVNVRLQRLLHFLLPVTFLKVFGRNIRISSFEATVLWPPYSYSGGEYDVRSLRSTSDATRCQPFDGQHCGPISLYYFLN